MIVTKISDAKPMLYECFKSDPELLEKWHIEAGKGLDVCVERTNKDIISASVDVYKLEKDNKLVGYFGVELCFLSGFFVKPEYRNKEDITEFWSIVNKAFKNEPFYCGIYEKNQRALKFLLKNNGRIKQRIRTDSGEGMFLILNEVK